MHTRTLEQTTHTHRNATDTSRVRNTHAWIHRHTVHNVHTSDKKTYRLRSLIIDRIRHVYVPKSDTYIYILCCMMLACCHIHIFFVTTTHSWTLPYRIYNICRQTCTYTGTWLDPHFLETSTHTNTRTHTRIHTEHTANTAATHKPGYT